MGTETDRYKHTQIEICRLTNRQIGNGTDRLSHIRQIDRSTSGSPATYGTIQICFHSLFFLCSDIFRNLKKVIFFRSFCSPVYVTCYL